MLKPLRMPCSILAQSIFQTVAHTAHTYFYIIIILLKKGS